jgi:hypothetical protein
MTSSEPNPERAPAVVTVFGILILLHSVMGLCCSPLVVVMFQVPELAGEYPDNYDFFMYGTVLIGLPLVIYGFALSKGLLTRKHWARRHAVLWAGMNAAYLVIFIILDLAIFGIAWKLEQEVGLVSTVLEMFTYLAFFAFYGLTIFFMSRPPVKEFFGR